MAVTTLGLSTSLIDPVRAATDLVAGHLLKQEYKSRNYRAKTSAEKSIRVKVK